MSPSITTPASRDDVQVGCWSRLVRWRLGRGNPRIRDQVPVFSKTLPTELTRKPDNQELPPYVHFNHGWYGCYNGDAARASEFSDLKPPRYEENAGVSTEVIQTIDDTLAELSSDLRKLSLDIWNHPEVMFEERYAHERLTGFMSSHGFTVTPHYLGLETAWRAVFTRRRPTSSVADKRDRKKDIRVIGINSEMDALPGIGHACGHNLIAMSGVAVALAIKAALEKHDVPGTIVLLGTPAEEAEGGKITLLERGAYKDMDACIMSHPSSGPENFSALWPGIACQWIDVEFSGHGSHAGSAPWEAQNALDAAFVAYASISALRQQIRPDQRVHGIILGRDWVPNIIPDYAKLRYIVRAPTWVELEVLRRRVEACFEAAALATACKVEVTEGAGYYEVRNNDVLGQEYAKVVRERYGINTTTENGVAYSTDFGNVTFALPAIHPVYSIPTEPNGSNHTPQFAKSAAAPEAHMAALKVAAGLAATGFRVLHDAEFAERVKKSFDESKVGGNL